MSENILDKESYSKYFIVNLLLFTKKLHCCSGNDKINSLEMSLTFLGCLRMIIRGFTEQDTTCFSHAIFGVFSQHGLHISHRYIPQVCNHSAVKESKFDKHIYLPNTALAHKKRSIACR